MHNIINKSIVSKNTNTDNRVLNTNAEENTLKAFYTIKKWLYNISPTDCPQVTATQRFHISPKTKLSEHYPGNILLVQQFYLDPNANRHAENKRCLLNNVQNNFIDKIILLNERLYSADELGVTSNKIQQIIIKSRLSFKNVFEWTQLNNIDGYIVLANTDIFFDNTIDNIRKSNLHKEKKVFSLLRYEYTNNDLNKCKLFGPRPDSQDSWIWHTNNKLTNKQLNILDIQLGVPGCDNKIIYILNILGFLCYNEPELIRSYHFHSSQIRSYNKDTKKVPEPYYSIFPLLNNEREPSTHHTFNIIHENNSIFNYINNKVNNKEKFIIPRIAGIENELAVGGAIIKQGIDTGQLYNQNQIDALKKLLPTMKNNAGIKITTINSIFKYSHQYLSAFKKCERYFWWEPWGNVVRWIKNSNNFMILNFEQPKFDAVALDIFHSITRQPWTLALKGQRLLIISPFVDSFKKQIANREKIYGIDLFPECSFIFIKPPQTQGDNYSKEFDIELNNFIGEINKIKDNFDIALCSCGGYGNLVCNAIYDMNKSAIYIGGVLQMYFGIYGNRWLTERKDAMRLYLNNYWSRPQQHEKPSGEKKIENGCYW